VDAVPLTAELAAALAGLPLLERASWGSINLPAANSGVWEPLAQLGTRLESLESTIWERALPFGAEGLRQLPPGLLALTELGSMDAMIIQDNDIGTDASIPGLNRLPLRRVYTDCGAPIEVWTCPKLSWRPCRF